VHFASDPVFDSHGHHSVTDLPNLPPALQMDDDEGDPLARKKRKDEGLDMTPMVDVTFLLLIFFMVTASFSLQKSIPMPRQQTDAPSTNVQEEEEEDIDMVTVQIDEFGSFLVLAPDWERETPGKQNLITALREAIGESGGAVRLVIEVHEDAKLRFLVDCMDAGTIAGYSEAQVTQVDGFD
jgi:biopolymer transport protein ExbD